MFLSASTRALGIAAALLGVAAIPVYAQGRRQPAPVVRPAPPANAARPQQGGINPKVNGEHLSDWMNKHKDLNPQQQQEALEKEPGFHDLPPQTQQRYRDQLAHLNAMPPDKRQKRLEINEWMEHLTPEQRVQLTSATQQLANLPPDDRRYVARTFRGLRELSPAQRANVLNSERFNLTPAQRSTLNNLMKVEPFMPPAYDGGLPPEPQAH